jgi:hypothetical protein
VNRGRRAARGAVGVVMAALVVGCGVQLQDAAEPLPGGLLPNATPSPTATATEQETVVFFVTGRQLEGVAEPVTERSATGIMEALAAGPPIDREAELRSLLLDPLTSAPLLVVSSVTPTGEVLVTRTEGFLTLPATDQILLTGQVVHSMDGIGIPRVIMVDGAGAVVPVTLPDGRVQEGAVTAEDFADLLVAE